MHKIENQLRENIRAELSNLDNIKMPIIFKFIQKENGYKRIEDMIINTMIIQNTPINETLPHIEYLLEQIY